MSREDKSFESLVANTGASIPAERGKVNKALMEIRAAMPDVADDELALEISYRARVYKEVWPDVAIGPNALAQNWERVIAEKEKRETRQEGTNLAVSKDCQTCGGDRFVLTGTRPALQSQWMRERGIVPQGEYDEYSPCPDCNPSETSFRRHDGSWSIPLDPGQVKERMAQ